MPADAPSRWFEITKHPLMVLAASTLIGSIAVPVVTSQISASRARRELRVSHAISAVQAAGTTDRQLNLVLTAFANFVKDDAVADVSAKAALRNRVYDLYNQFDRDAWWWYGQLLREVQILELTDDRGRAEMSTAAVAYGENLKKATRSLEKLWGPLIATADPMTSDRLSDALKETTTEAATLQSERNALVEQMIRPLVR